MAKAEYEGVSGVARKAKSQNLGAGGVTRKVTKGLVGINGVARQFFAAKPTWKKYNTNVAYTLGCDVTTDDVAERCPPNSSTELYTILCREYGSWPYISGIVNGRGAPSGLVRLDQNTGKVYWVNDGSFKQFSTSSGSTSPRIRAVGSASDQEYNSVLFFHHYGPTGSSKYQSEHYKAFLSYEGRDNDTPTYYINLAWASVEPDLQIADLYATVLSYKTPKAQLYHFYPKASYSRGSYIGEVQADSEGAYPANGRHTDGFWYVKQ